MVIIIIFDVFIPRLRRKGEERECHITRAHAGGVFMHFSRKKLIRVLLLTALATRLIRFRSGND